MTSAQVRLPKVGALRESGPVEVGLAKSEVVGSWFLDLGLWEVHTAIRVTDVEVVLTVDE
jgi:hypothetical protein